MFTPRDINLANLAGTLARAQFAAVGVGATGAGGFARR